MKPLFSMPLYIKAYTDSFVLRDLFEQKPEQHFSASRRFSNQRMLVANFTHAQHCLKQAVNAMLPKHFIRRRPALLIQPMELIEGGLSQIEERVFHELARGAGAYRVVLWTGRELSDKEALHKLFNKTAPND